MSFVDTFFNSDVMISAFPQLLRGLWMTIALGVVSIVIGVTAGLIVSLIRLYAPKPLQLLMIAYIDIMRAMPMLVVLILIYYALPFIGISFSAWWSAILGLLGAIAVTLRQAWQTELEDYVSVATIAEHERAHRSRAAQA